MAAKAVDYVKTTLKRLPNLFARRDTIRFEDTPAEQRSGGFDAPSGIFVPYQPLHPISRSTRTVAYRDGQEIDETTGEEQNTSAAGANGLTTIGEFGPFFPRSSRTCRTVTWRGVIGSKAQPGRWRYFVSRFPEARRITRSNSAA